MLSIHVVVLAQALHLFGAIPYEERSRATLITAWCTSLQQFQACLMHLWVLYMPSSFTIGLIGCVAASVHVHLAQGSLKVTHLSLDI